MDYYPSSMFIHIDSPQIKYGKKNAIGPGFAKSLNSFLRSIKRDRRALRDAIKKYKFDVVISDNRPGLFSEDIKSIYISHQINVKTRKPKSLSGKLVKSYHKRYIEKFDCCLIPDEFGENSLSGQLSLVGSSNKFKSVGVLSRFSRSSNIGFAKVEEQIDLLVLISGPEPHRTIFEDLIIKRFSLTNKKVVLVRGLVKNESISDIDNISFYNNPSDKKLLELINASKRIICRSGYSTLMDLAVCGRKAILIPTPGQPEQEYLAERFKDKFDFPYLKQNDILTYEFSAIEEYSKWEYPIETDKLKNISFVFRIIIQKLN